MSTRDRRSQRIRDQIRVHANPRSGQHASFQRPLQAELKRIYGGEHEGHAQHEAFPIAAEIARLRRRRR
ncbi:MAG TPA: hypothetical protein VLA19_04140 [Herpetosiphonaceae bacterium]|nr:hypothetical protein [Herpetosiphonaceae bacterium]